MNEVLRSSRRIFIKNIPWTCTSKEVLEYFRQFGKVTKTCVFFNSETGFSRRHGYIDVSKECLEKIQNTPQHSLEGKELLLSLTGEPIRFDYAKTVQA